MTNVDPHAGWMAEHDRFYIAANASGASEDEAGEAVSQLCRIESKLIETPATTLAGSLLRCLAVVKLSADGHTVDDAQARAIEHEADAFRAELREKAAAFAEAYREYERVRAISDTFPSNSLAKDPSGKFTVDRLVEDYFAAMGHLIEKVPAPTIAALRIKIALAESRSSHSEGWFEDHRRAIMEDLDYFETRMLSA